MQCTIQVLIPLITVKGPCVAVAFACSDTAWDRPTFISFLRTMCFTVTADGAPQPLQPQERSSEGQSGQTACSGADCWNVPLLLILPISSLKRLHGPLSTQLCIGFNLSHTGSNATTIGLSLAPITLLSLGPVTLTLGRHGFRM